MQKINSKPKPIWVRLLQNPNFHLSLIGLLMTAVVLFIIYAQRELVTREVRTFLDLPLSSRDAGDPDEASEDSKIQSSNEEHSESKASDQNEEPAPDTTAQLAAESAVPTNTVKPKEESKLAPPATLHISALEVPREILVTLLQVADKINESSAGRIFYFSQGDAINKTLEPSSRTLGRPKTTPLQVGSHIEIETPATAPEAFQFALYVQQSKWDGREGQLRIEATLVLPQPETPQEALVPTVKSVMELGLSGLTPLNTNGLVMILIEPPNRNPRAEFVTKAGVGPWNVFQSEEFKMGISEWVILVQLK